MKTESKNFLHFNGQKKQINYSKEQVVRYERLVEVEKQCQAILYKQLDDTLKSTLVE